MRDLQAIAYAMLARLEQARGNPEEAQEAMRQAERLAGGHPLSPGRSIQLKSDLAAIGSPREIWRNHPNSFREWFVDQG